MPDKSYPVNRDMPGHEIPPTYSPRRWRVERSHVPQHLSCDALHDLHTSSITRHAELPEVSKTGVIWTPKGAALVKGVSARMRAHECQWTPRCTANGARLPEISISDLNLPSQGRFRDC